MKFTEFLNENDDVQKYVKQAKELMKKHKKFKDMDNSFGDKKMEEIEDEWIEIEKFIPADIQKKEKLGFYK